MEMPDPFGDKRLDGLSRELSFFVTEEDLCFGVGHGDAAFFVDSQSGIGHEPEEELELIDGELPDYWDAGWPVQRVTP
jgi:hypothetical protein